MRKLLLSAFIVSAALLSVSCADGSYGFAISTPMPPDEAGVVPVDPGADFFWVDGYWYPNGGGWLWHDGYWTLPPYAGAFWRAPYVAGGRYYQGRWEGERGYVNHSHRWDRTAQRDGNRAPRGGRPMRPAAPRGRTR